MSICIAIIPPKQVVEAIRDVLRSYRAHMSMVTPKETWHIPLGTTMSLPTLQPIRHSFHQTMRILSIGEGEERSSLCVRIQQGPSVTALQAALPKETSINTPHILLGSFETIPAFGILDTPLAMTFSIRELHVIQTDPYEILGTIPITS